MKYNLHFIALLFISMVGIKTASAITLTSFSIESPYLNGGNVYLNSNPTNVVFDFTIDREFVGTSLQNVDFTASLIYRDATGTETNLSTPVTITTSDFGGQNIEYSLRVAANIPTGDFGGIILLKYTSQEIRSGVPTQVTGYSSTQYGETMGGTPIPQPVLYPPFDVFPTSYTSTSFNVIFTDPSSSVPATKITTSDSQPVLTPGQSIYSPNGSYRLTLQTDGNLVLYKEGTTETALWGSGTQGQASTSLYFQTDGNLVIYTGTFTPLNPHIGSWSAGIANSAGLGNVANAYYALQNDGNFVFYWPTYDFGAAKFEGWVIMAATDTGGGVVTGHHASLSHPIDPSPAASQAGSNFHSTR